MPRDAKSDYIRNWSAGECDSPEYRFEITRRELGVLGFGIVLSLIRPPAAGAQSAQTLTRIHISGQGPITLMTGKVELGQGSRTILTQVVAEEMRVPPGRVHVLMGDTDLVPDDGGTWGSLTSPQTVPVVRKAAAAARRLLDPSDAAVDDAIPVAPAEWKVCGTSLPPVMGREIVTGALKYPSDWRAPGMLHARIVRAPWYKGKLVGYKAPDSVKTVRDGDLLGVIAGAPYSAAVALRSVRAEWSGEPLPPRTELFDHLRRLSTPPPAGESGRYPPLISAGDVKGALASAAHQFEAKYTLPYIAHVPLEPRAAVAEWKDGRLTVWTGTQAPFLVRSELATAFHIPESAVRVITLDTGSAFGGKQRAECEIEAARMAKGAGAPVKLAWTREEEFTSSYCRPAAIVDVAAGLDAEGRITGWRHQNYNSGAASLRPPYAIANLSCEYHRSQSPLRQGSYRSLAAVANNFAREMHVDELARHAKTDPLEFRLRNLDNQRVKTVLERAAERFRWKGQKNAGLSCNLEKDGHLALFTEIEDHGKRGIRVTRMVLAIDVGAILNPDGLRKQATGALIQGMGGALFEELTFDSRTITNARLSRYRVPRFQDVPKIEVILVDRRDIESAGSGEAPITVVAPAIGAAIRSATGRQCRSLPLTS